MDNRRGGMDASVFPFAGQGAGGTPPPVLTSVAFSFFAQRDSTLSYYVAAQGGGIQTGDVTPALNTLLAFPFVIGSTRTADRTSIFVTTSGGAGSQFRFGLYNNQSDTVLYPTSLIADSGVRDGTVTGFHEVTISVAFSAGLYWAAFICGTGAPVMREINVNTFHPLLGSDVSGAHIRGLSVALAFGALPASFPAGAAYATANVPSSHRLRYSA